MTPLEIEILLHYDSRAGDYRDGDFSAPAVSDAISWFSLGLQDPLLVKTGRRDCKYALSERGKAYVDALKAVPYPVCKWVIP